jgi:hypothetical protein
MYGYEAEEVIGKANSDILHAPEAVATGKPREMVINVTPFRESSTFSGYCD